MKIRTDFVTNSSSSSFILTFNVKTRDSDEWNVFEISNSDGDAISGESSPKQLSKCATVKEMFKKFHDETYADGYTVDEKFDGYKDENGNFVYECLEEDYVQTLAKGEFFKFSNEEIENINNFLKKYGEEKVSECITEISINGYEYNERESTSQSTSYTYNLETKEYTKEIIGDVELYCEGNGGAISVPDESEVTKFIEEYDEEDDDEYEDDEY